CHAASSVGKANARSALNQDVCPLLADSGQGKTRSTMRLAHCADTIPNVEKVFDGRVAGAEEFCEAPDGAARFASSLPPLRQTNASEVNSVGPVHGQASHRA